MENVSKPLKDYEDPEVFKIIRDTIEKELSNMKKIVNNISQLRVETAYLEADMVMTIDSSTWLELSELIGLGTMNVMGIESRNNPET